MKNAEIIRQLILNQPTWVEGDSYRAQCDMRLRCADVAANEVGELEKNYLDTLERQSERIQQMHVELATKDKRIATLLEANRDLAGKVRK